jgi:hypothetical protein
VLGTTQRRHTIGLIPSSRALSRTIPPASGGDEGDGSSFDGGFGRCVTRPAYSGSPGSVPDTPGILMLPPMKNRKLSKGRGRTPVPVVSQSGIVASPVPLALYVGIRVSTPLFQFAPVKIRLPRPVSAGKGRRDCGAPPWVEHSLASLYHYQPVENPPETQCMPSRTKCRSVSTSVSSS